MKGETPDKFTDPNIITCSENIVDVVYKKYAKTETKLDNNL
jgi:hypothetical protein